MENNRLRLAKFRVAVCGAHYVYVIVALTSGLIFADVVFARDRSHTVDIISVKNAMQRSLCYDVYWRGGWGSGEFYQLYVPHPLQIVFDSPGTFAAKVDPIAYEGPHQSPVVIYRYGLLVDNLAYVVSTYKRGGEDIFKKFKVENESITLNDCFPTFEREDNIKQQYMNTIMKTAQKWARRLAAQKQLPSPGNVTVDIANFNVWYPTTYIYIENYKAIFIVSMHAENDFFGTKLLESGEFPTRSPDGRLYRAFILKRIVENRIRATIPSDGVFNANKLLH